MVSHDRWIERASLRVDGRRHQYVHQRLRQRGALPGSERLSRLSAELGRRANSRHPVSPDDGAIRYRPDRARRDWVPQSRARASDAEESRRRCRCVRQSVPRIHPCLGVQASDAWRFFPDYREQHWGRSFVVLAQLLLHDGCARPWDRQRRNAKLAGAELCQGLIASVYVHPVSGALQGRVRGWHH